MVGEDDELTGLDGINHAGLGNASVGEQLGGLGRKLTKGAGLEMCIRDRSIAINYESPRMPA